MKIININGMEVLTKNFTEETISVDISNQPQGIYFIKVENQDFANTFKIILK